MQVLVKSKAWGHVVTEGVVLFHLFSNPFVQSQPPKMGNCFSNTEERHSKDIDKQIKQEEKKVKTEVKLLLLGTPLMFDPTL
jgi:hypothetical protein